MRLPFHPEALIEIDQAVAWHERERAGYGSILFDEVVRKVEQAAHFPRSGAPVLGFDARYDAGLLARPVAVIGAPCTPNGCEPSHARRLP